MSDIQEIPLDIAEDIQHNTEGVQNRSQGRSKYGTAKPSGK